MGPVTPFIPLIAAGIGIGFQAEATSTGRKVSRSRRQEALDEQKALQKRQQEALERTPRRTVSTGLTPRTKRLRRGILANIRTSSRGVTRTPTLSTQTLAGGKTLLGQ